MVNKSIRAIYCDDVRQEVGGKVSLMGIYNSDMILPSFPAILPKLCVQLTITLPYDQPPKKSVRVLLLNNADVLAEMSIDEESLANTPLPNADMESDSEDMALDMAVGFMLSSLRFDAPTRLRVRAYIDGEELKANALRIRAPQAEEPHSLETSA
jgi:hypothetical protein